MSSCEICEHSNCQISKFQRFQIANFQISYFQRFQIPKISHFNFQFPKISNSNLPLLIPISKDFKFPLQCSTERSWICDIYGCCRIPTCYIQMCNGKSCNAFINFCFTCPSSMSSHVSRLKTSIQAMRIELKFSVWTACLLGATWHNCWSSYTCGIRNPDLEY